jgi:hypothetical protein
VVVELMVVVEVVRVIVTAQQRVIVKEAIPIQMVMLLLVLQLIVVVVVAVVVQVVQLVESLLVA